MTSKKTKINQTHENTIKQINLKAIQKMVDIYAIDILGSSPRCAVYTFTKPKSDETKTKWEKSGVEGVLYIYKYKYDRDLKYSSENMGKICQDHHKKSTKNGTMGYAFTILNKSDDDKIVEKLDSSDIIEIKMNDQVIQYLSKRHNIKCIWFSKPDECQSTFKLLKKYYKKVSKSKKSDKSKKEVDDKYNFETKSEKQEQILDQAVNFDKIKRQPSQADKNHFSNLLGLNLKTENKVVENESEESYQSSKSSNKLKAPLQTFESKVEWLNNSKMKNPFKNFEKFENKKGQKFDSLDPEENDKCDMKLLPPSAFQTWDELDNLKDNPIKFENKTLPKPPERLLMKPFYNAEPIVENFPDNSFNTTVLSSSSISDTDSEQLNLSNEKLRKILIEVINDKNDTRFLDLIRERILENK